MTGRVPRRIAGGLLALLIGLLLAELALRGFALVAGGLGRRLASRDLLGTVYEPYGAYGYRPRAGRTETFINGTVAHYNRMHYRGPPVSLTRPPGTYRIVLLGGSTTVGFGAGDEETIDAYLRRILGAEFPGICVEVVNLGLGGYDSYQDFERFRVDGTALHPDFVVVHSGINDVGHARFRSLSAPPDRKTLLWESVMQTLRNKPSLWVRIKHLSYLARFPGFLRDTWSQTRQLGAIESATPHDAALDYFEINLRRIDSMAYDIGARVLLSAPPSAISIRNKTDDPIERAYWIRDAGTTEAYRNRLYQRMEQVGREEAQAGRPVSFMTHTLPLDQYLDDAHLLPPGNRTVAADLARAIRPALREALPGLLAQGGCRGSTEEGQR